MNARQKRKSKKYIAKKKLKVVLVAQSDWSNLGGNYAKSLQEIGVDATMFIKSSHRFKYPNQGKIFKNSQSLRPHIKNATIVHMLHSHNPIPDINLKDKKVVVSHTGSKYRNKYKEVNKIFNPIVDMSIVGGDLYGKGAKNENWIPGGIVNTNLLKPVYQRSSNKIVVSHFPSSYKMKGSSNIVKAMKNVKCDFIFNYNPSVISWVKNMNRVRKCDIYIERFKQNSGFGMAALEAAALGKIVITTYAFKEKYEETTGEFGLISVKTIEELTKEVERIINLPYKEILEMKKKTRKWVEKYHSYEAVGMRLFNLYRKIL